MQEIWVQSLGWEDPLEKGMATNSSILAWRIPWTKEPGRLQSMGSQRVGHDWVTKSTSRGLHREMLHQVVERIGWNLRWKERPKIRSHCTGGVKAIIDESHWESVKSWWWTGRPGVLWFMVLQRVGHDWETELNWRSHLGSGYRACDLSWGFQVEAEKWWGGPGS